MKNKIKFIDFTQFQLYFVRSNTTKFLMIQVHMRLHTGAKPYKCSHCTQMFRTPAARQLHVKQKHKYQLTTLDEGTNVVSTDSESITMNKKSLERKEIEKNSKEIKSSDSTMPKVNLTLPIEELFNSGIIQRKVLL